MFDVDIEQDSTHLTMIGDEQTCLPANHNIIINQEVADKCVEETDLLECRSEKVQTFQHVEKRLQTPVKTVKTRLQNSKLQSSQHAVEQRPKIVPIREKKIRKEHKPFRTEKKTQAVKANKMQKSLVISRQRKHLKQFDFFFFRSCFRIMNEFFKDKFKNFYNNVLVKQGTPSAQTTKEDIDNILRQFMEDTFSKHIF